MESGLIKQFSNFKIKKIFTQILVRYFIKALMRKQVDLSFTNPNEIDFFQFSRVAVMRGQVVSPQGLGIVGIRVSVDRESKFGFTLTRTGGW